MASSLCLARAFARDEVDSTSVKSIDSIGSFSESGGTVLNPGEASRPVRRRFLVCDSLESVERCRTGGGEDESWGTRGRRKEALRSMGWGTRRPENRVTGEDCFKVKRVSSNIAGG